MPFQTKENLPVLKLDFVPEGSISEEEFNSLQSKTSPLDQKPMLKLDFVPEGSLSEEEYQALSSKPKDSPPASPNDILEARTMPETLSAAYNNFSQLPEDSKKQLFNDMARIAIKAPVAGAASLLDFFTTLPKNATAAALNAITPDGWKAPYDTSYEEAAEKGVDYLANKAGLDTSGGGKVYEGAKLAASVATGGGLGSVGKLASKAPNLISKGLTFVGSTKPNVILGAGGAGAAMEAARENEAGILKTLGAGVAGAAAAEALPFVLNKKSWSQLGQKGLIKSLGLGKDKIKLDVLESAEKLGVDLPVAAATDSVATAFVTQAITKIPQMGDKLRTQVKNTSNQFQSAWNGMLDSIAPKIDHELNQEAKSIYKIPNNLIKNSEDSISPSLILDKIKETKEFLKSPVLSDPTKKLFSYMDELEKSLVPQGIKITSKDLPQGFLKLSKEVQEQVLSELKSVTSIPHLPVQEVLRAKIELNKIMRDKNLFDKKDTDTLGFLNGIRSSIQDTLEEYGKTNPKWFKAFKEADKKYGNLAKRENLEDLLSGKIVDAATQEVSYTPLVKILEDPSRQKFLKNNLGASNYKKLNDFVNVARSMDAAKRNILNPSSTAIVGSVVAALHGLVLGTNVIPTAAGGLSVYGLTKLFTNKKFLNTATQFAKSPTEPLAHKINTLIKDHTGVGVQSILQNIQNNQN